MNQKKIIKIVPVVTIITYLAMVIINALANIIPINNRGTGDVSDSYNNLFAPAPITFAIWGVIYFLLLGYSINQLRYYSLKEEEKKAVFVRIGVPFSISSIANSIWIFAWHYEVIWLSLLLMICILLCLIDINMVLKNHDFNMFEQFFIRIPFTIYLGWITVATIANIVTFLVDINWNRFSLSEILWTIIIVCVGGIIGFLGILYYHSITYGLVIIWAYIGILIKRLMPEEFEGEYISIIVVVITSILLLLAGLISLIFKKRRKMDRS